MSLHVKVENEGSKEPNLTMKMLKGTLKKMRPWSGTGWDQIYTFMWQKMTSMHQLLLQIISDLLRMSHVGNTWKKCVDWEEEQDP